MTIVGESQRQSVNYRTIFSVGQTQFAKLRYLISLQMQLDSGCALGVVMEVLFNLLKSQCLMVTNIDAERNLGQ